MWNDGKRSQSSRWAVITASFLIQFVVVSSRNLFPILLVFVEEALGMSHADSGVLLSINSLFWVVGALIWGKISDAVKNMGALLLAACMTVSIGTVFMGSINSFIEGVIAHSLIGFGSAAPIVLITKIVAVKFDKCERAIALSYANSGMALSGMLMGALAPPLAISYCWRFPFHLLGVVFSCLSILIYVLVKDLSKENYFIDKAETEQHQRKRVENMENSIKMIFQVGLVHFFSATTLICITNFLVAYLIESGLEKLAAGYAYGIYTLSNFLGMFFWGFLSDRTSRKRVLSLAVFLQTIFITLILIYKQEPIIYAEIIFLGFSTGILPTVLAMTTELFSLKNLGTSTGISISFAGIAGIVSPLLVGTLATFTRTLSVSLQYALLTAVATIVSIELGMKRYI